MTDNSIEGTLAQRGARYGAFKDQAKISQALKDVARAQHGWQRLAPDQKEAIEMILHKTARMLNGDADYIDGWRDLVGYAKLVMDRLLATPGATDAKVEIVTVAGPISVPDARTPSTPLTMGFADYVMQVREKPNGRE